MYKILAFVLIGILAISPQCFANRITQSQHGDNYPAYPKIVFAKYPNAKQIKRGEYIAQLGDCIACHTNSKHLGQPFAGGLPFTTPFGVYFSPNITPDKATGIGRWTEGEFMRAMRDGIGPNGNYFPVFPFVYFNKVTDQDLKDLWAYLQVIPAVNLRNRKVQANFPYNSRFLQAAWKVLFFQIHKGQVRFNKTKSPLWNRGNYIVNGLGHCGQCHTPTNSFGAAKRNQFLGGAMVGKFYAENITSASLGTLSVKDIVTLFTKEKNLNQSDAVRDPMTEVDHDSLKYLTKEDLIAIATYLKDVPAVEVKKIKMKGGESLIGKSVYTSKCAICHDSGAAGAPKIGDSQAWQPRIAQGILTLELHAINGLNAMPPKGACMTCSDNQIRDAVKYIVSNSQPGAKQQSTTQSNVPPQVERTLVMGKKVYNHSCAMCHSNGKYGAPIIGDKTVWKPLLREGIPVLYQRAIQGYKLHPIKGACLECSIPQIQAAVKYMAQQSSDGKDFSLW